MRLRTGKNNSSIKHFVLIYDKRHIVLWQSFLLGEKESSFEAGSPGDLIEISGPGDRSKKKYIRSKESFAE
jgi:hypothetical protein